MAGINLNQILFLTTNIVILPDIMLSRCCWRCYKSPGVLRR